MIKIKKISSQFLLVMALFAVGLFSTQGTALAAPFKAAENNPQVVAYYPDGPHTVVSEPEGHHYGQDLVMMAGKSGNFQQWLYGTQPATNTGLHGDHDLWKLSKDGTCPDKTTKVENAYPTWGDYLMPGETYCVKSNDFHPNK